MSFHKVITGDCLEVLRTLDAGSIDAVVTDPPYGIDFQSARRIESHRFDVIEGDGAPATAWIPAATTALREGGALVCFCRWDVAEAFRAGIVAAGLVIRSQVIWDRVVHGLGDLEAAFSPRHDTVWFATKGDGFKFPGKRPASVMRHMRVSPNDLTHPCEKPVPLMADLIEAVAARGSTILDPFCGSGTTGVACKLTGRNFIGIEIDEGYANIARRRIAEAASLFHQDAPKDDPLLIA